MQTTYLMATTQLQCVETMRNVKDAGGPYLLTVPGGKSLAPILHAVTDRASRSEESHLRAGPRIYATQLRHSYVSLVPRTTE